MDNDIFLEMEYCQFIKTGQAACGDDCQMLSLEDENRGLAVLSDGLGSGVKANMLANMTTTMALKFMRSNMDPLHSVETIMDSLPVCEVRKISYATFSMVDVRVGGVTRVFEMGNPRYIHFRSGMELPPLKHSSIVSERWPDRQVDCYELRMEPGDRLVFCSDGVTQAGLGRSPWKFGWGRDNLVKYAENSIRAEPEISAYDLAHGIAFQANLINPDKCVDDITCFVVYMRHPRVMRILTGPPFRKENDADFAACANLGEKHTVVCGGTTANILQRELHASVELDLNLVHSGDEVPPPGKMPGIAAVTEGILTLSRVAAALEKGEYDSLPAAVRLIVSRMLEHDRIEFIVGTRVNEAHQDPNLPVELELRRNVVHKIGELLESKYRKKVRFNYY